ncbi:RDD family protein [Mucilaginibacter sp. PAMB04274]|uniref:RDD family protein n=1 Tax=Mucilaginibacter sp. PAMB04274 TaxID=3138568 RepID=UPI0031F7073E
MDTIAETNATPTANYPSLVRRFQSMFIDTLLIIIAMVLISATLSNITNTPDWIRIALFVFLFGCYEPFFMAFTKGTMGNRLMGIQIKQAKDESKKPSLVQT